MLLYISILEYKPFYTETQNIIVQKKGTNPIQACGLSGCSSALPFYKPNPPQAENYYSLRIGIISSAGVLFLIPSTLFLNICVTQVFEPNLPL